MKKYTVGFMVQNGLVLLIQKNRPRWQAGKMNGIGGHIEPNEEPSACMAREFYEETGIVSSQSDWVLKVILTGNDWQVYFYLYIGGKSLFSAEAKTDEDLRIIPVKHLWDWPVIPNLRWLIPLCTDETIKFPIIIEDTLP